VIFTSNFSKQSNYNGKLDLIGIVRIPPKGSNPLITFDTLIAPSRKLLKSYKNSEITEEQYREVYIKQLNRIGADTIYKVYNNKILLCYCGEHSFCHRHILREWLSNHNILSEEI